MSLNLSIKKIVPFFLLLSIVVGIFSPIAAVNAGLLDDLREGQAILEESAAAADAQTNPEYKFGCGVIFTADPLCLAAQGSVVMLKFFSGVSTFLGGTLLDFSIKETIVNSDEYFRNPGVETAWSILRDLANIFFIFILLFIGIVTILQTTKFEYKQLLRNLIIMALLVNFSFFLTQLVIDVSNVMSTEIYKEIGGGSLSTTFMKEMNLESLFDPDSFLSESIGNGDIGEEVWSKILIVGIFGSVLLLITTFIFVATAILLVSRVVILSFLLAAAPLAFAAFVLPSTVKYFRMWGEKLVANAFFAPIYLLGVFLSLEMMERATPSGKKITFVESLISGDAGNISVIFHFMLISGFMIASLIIAKQIGAFGAASVANIGDRARKGVQGALLRQTIGRVAGASSYLGRGLKTVPYVGRALGTPLTAIGGLGANAKFGTDKGYLDAKAAKAKKITDEGSVAGKEFGLKAKRRYGKNLSTPLLGGRNLPGFAKKQAKQEILGGRDIKKLEESEAYTKQGQKLVSDYNDADEAENNTINRILEPDKMKEAVALEIDANGDRGEMDEINESLKQLVSLQRKGKKMTKEERNEHRELKDKEPDLRGRRKDITSKAIQTGNDKYITKQKEKRAFTPGQRSRKAKNIQNAEHQRDSVKRATKKRSTARSKIGDHVGNNPNKQRDSQEEFEENMEEYQKRNPQTPPSA